MSPQEREHLKKIDEQILKASGKSLKKIQEIDLKTQLEGKSFYDVYANHQYNQKETNLASATHQKKKAK